jgi:GrpB-like predicted nucleotidyltransferase (UPF0157 family)
LAAVRCRGKDGSSAVACRLGFSRLAAANAGARPVVPYDAAWPDRFEARRERLASLHGPVACRVDHVGPTSVPGLAAKPIVGIQTESQEALSGS